MSEHADRRADGVTGQEPDVRDSYANERTFLAWNRTALALIATGVAATQLLPEFAAPFGRRLLGLPLVALGAYVALGSYRQWRRNDQAMREGKPLPASRMAMITAVVIGLVAVAAVALGAFEAR
jgi:putative membrane protein